MRSASFSFFRGFSKRDTDTDRGARMHFAHLFSSLKRALSFFLARKSTHQNPNAARKATTAAEATAAPTIKPTLLGPEAHCLLRGGPQSPGLLPKADGGWVEKLDGMTPLSLL
ncbi:hypothetical protein GOP47_0030245 [Adiantum capillus-veneris]|nr:hypothetical protein GOP47_0030245 [Adiantum capillus-veneris]